MNWLRQLFTACTMISFCCATPARAEIATYYVYTAKDAVLHTSRYPDIVVPRGWAQEHGISAGSVGFFITPNGATTGPGGTQIYVKAWSKATHPEIKDISSFVDRDLQAFRGKAGDTEELPPLVDSDGKSHRILSFKPQGAGNWEACAYGDEGAYYLLFCMVANEAAGYAQAIDALNTIVRSYQAIRPPTLQPVIANLDEVSVHDVVQSYWYPVLAPPSGWAVDEAASIREGVLAFSPAGAAFNSSDVVLYAEAIPKSNWRHYPNLDGKMAMELAQMDKASPLHGLMHKVRKPRPIQAADGKTFYVFTDKSLSTKAPSEAQAYSEQGDFIVVIHLQCRRGNFPDAYDTFAEFVANYAKNKP